MKIQIDTENKVIKIEESVNLGDLMKSLKQMLPFSWEEFTLETTVINNFTNPTS